MRPAEVGARTVSVSIPSSMTNIATILSPDAVKVPLLATGKREIIDELIDLLDESGLIDDPDTLKQVVWEREQQRSTGIGEGLAIPHGKSNCSKELVMAVGRPGQPIDFDAVDGEPVSLVVLLASPPDRTSEHIQALGKISRLMSDPNFRVRAYSAESSEELYRLFEQAQA